MPGLSTVGEVLLCQVRKLEVTSYHARSVNCKRGLTVPGLSTVGGLSIPVLSTVGLTMPGLSTVGLTVPGLSTVGEVLACQICQLYVRS